MRRRAWLGLLLFAGFMVGACNGGSEGQSARTFAIDACTKWVSGGGLTTLRRAASLATSAADKNEKYYDLALYLRRHVDALPNAEQRGTLADFFDTRELIDEQCAQFDSLSKAVLECFGDREPRCVERKLDQARR